MSVDRSNPCHLPQQRLVGSCLTSCWLYVMLVICHVVALSSRVSLPIGITSMQVLVRTAMEAHKNNDEVALSVLMWELCHNVLLGGNGPHVKVSDVLQMVDQVHHPHAS